MRKILHLIPTLEGGGAERQLSMLAVEQAKRGWNVHIALRRRGVFSDLLGKSGVVIHQLGDFKGAHPALLTRAQTLVSRLKPRLLHTWLPQMDIIGGVLTLCNRLCWVLSERASKEAYQGRSILTFLRCRLAHHVSAVVANSGEGTAYWRRRLPVGTTVSTIPNAVDVAAIRGTPLQACQLLASDCPFFLFVGRLAPQKAPEVFIQAFATMAKARTASGVVIGQGPMLEEIQSRIQANGLDSCLRVLPYQQEWWGLLKSATALVSPSRFEGFPNVVLESMAAGCPLIVSDILQHRSFLDDESALFVPKDDPVALADALGRLMDDPQAARKRAARAYECATRFTVDVAADAYDGVYAAVLQERAS
jgi:glycosyltransferase involved in cell wall biosynthesis